MNQGIKAPKKMVVTKTINKTVLFITCTALSYSGVAFYGAYTVKISAKATDPLMVPAVDTIAIQLRDNTHFENNLKMKAKPNIAAIRETMQMRS